MPGHNHKKDFLSTTNFYTVLGISKDATSIEIKKAYRQLCLAHHPDKGDGTDRDRAQRHEMTASINEAYRVLSDNDTRRDHDDLLDTCIFDEDLKENAEKEAVTGRSETNSMRFKRLHTRILENVKQDPNHLPLFKSPAYSKTQHFFFQQLTQKTANASEVLIDIDALSQRYPETEKLAIHLLTCFMKQEIYGDNIKLVRLFIFSHQLKSSGNNKVLGDRLIEILSNFLDIAEHVDKKTPNEILTPFKQLLQLAASTPEVSIPVIEPLLQTSAFRKVYAQTVETFWQHPVSTQQVLEESIQKLTTLGPIEGFIQRLRTAFTQQRRKLSEYREKTRLTPEEQTAYDSLASENRTIKQQLLNLNNLARFCQDIGWESNLSTDPVLLRNRAYSTLDWCNTIGEHGPAMLVNTMLLAGAYFQAAAYVGSKATEPNIPEMTADMQLSLIAYTQAYDKAQRLSPDEALRVTWHISAFLSPIGYEGATPLLTSVKKHALQILDFFPVYSELKTGFETAYHNKSTLDMMRKLLTIWIERAYQEHKDTQGASLPLTHNPEDLFYRAYDGGISKWYQPKSVSLSTIRLDMMHALLQKNGWNFNDISQNISPPFLMVAVDNQGWFKGDKIPFPNTIIDGVSLQKYQAVKGMHIDFEEGHFMLGLIPAQNSEEALFTQYDVYDAMGRENGFSYFSLEEPKNSFGLRYHPFQEIICAPKDVPSELRNTMFLTDDVLKFITTGYQVQFVHPFEIKPIDTLLDRIEKQSPILAQSIREYHRHSKPGTAHRFWIEQAEMPYTVDDSKEGHLSYCFGKSPMYVRTHCLIRDLLGNLVDDTQAIEGWPIYVLNAESIQALQDKKSTLTDPFAIIVQKDKSDVHFIEYGDCTAKSIPNAFNTADREALFSHQGYELDKNNKIILQKKSPDFDSLVYHLTRSITDVARKEHRFTPERILAESLTTHYGDLGKVFPEFNRLQALCTLSSISGIVNRLKSTFKNRISSFESNLAHFPIDIKNELDKKLLIDKTKFWENLYTKINTSISSQIVEVTPTIIHNIHQNVCGYYQQVQNNVSNHSNNLNNAIEKMKQDICRKNGFSNWHAIPAEARNPLENKWNTEITTAKNTQFNALRTQIYHLYRTDLSGLNEATYNQLIDQFMQGHYTALANQLVSAENIPQQVTNSVHKQYRELLIKEYPGLPKSDIEQLLKGKVQPMVSSLHPTVLAETMENYRKHWAEQIAIHQKLLEQFKQVGIQIEPNTDENSIDDAHVNAPCPWIPSSSSYNSTDRRQVHGGVFVTASARIANEADRLYRNLSSSCVFLSNNSFSVYEAERFINKYQFSLPTIPEFFTTQFKIRDLQRKVDEVRREELLSLNKPSNPFGFSPINQHTFMYRPVNMLNFRLSENEEKKLKETHEHTQTEIPLENLGFSSYDASKATVASAWLDGNNGRTGYFKYYSSDTHECVWAKSMANDSVSNTFASEGSGPTGYHPFNSFFKAYNISDSFDLVRKQCKPPTEAALKRAEEYAQNPAIHDMNPRQMRAFLNEMATDVRDGFIYLWHHRGRPIEIIMEAFDEDFERKQSKNR
jgi:hypothetical protein